VPATKARKPRTAASFRSPDRDPELLTVEQAADYFNVSPRWVRRAVDERRIEFVKVGIQLRFRREALDAYLAANTHGPR
jgi:excisionase family DNA binding protein